MGLGIGIVGLPNVGKSTLFNALLKKQAALAANYPFATIEPNIGVVGVPDERLNQIAKVANSAQIVPSTVKFVDIAGLVKGASTGEGLGNKFLSHIREVDAIVQVIRDFTDPDVIRAGSVDPKSDDQVIMTELKLADLQTLDSIRTNRKDQTRANLAGRIYELLEKDGDIKSLNFTEEEKLVVGQMSLLVTKPVIKVLNVDENDVNKTSDNDSIIICAKTEAELAGLSDDEQLEYLKSLGLSEPGLNKLVKQAFKTLGLQSFLTAGEKEARAWTIRIGTKAPQAAGVIHTDFEKHFIKADVIDWQDFVSLGGWSKAREVGKVRLEGREYVMQEGDVVEFKVGV